MFTRVSHLNTSLVDRFIVAVLVAGTRAQVFNRLQSPDARQGRQPLLQTLHVPTNFKLPIGVDSLALVSACCMMEARGCE